MTNEPDIISNSNHSFSYFRIWIWYFSFDISTQWQFPGYFCFKIWRARKMSQLQIKNESKVANCSLGSGAMVFMPLSQMCSMIAFFRFSTRECSLFSSSFSVNYRFQTYKKLVCFRTWRLPYLFQTIVCTLNKPPIFMAEIYDRKEKIPVYFC